MAMRFELDYVDDGINEPSFWVWDNELDQVVPGSVMEDSKEALNIFRTMNQRVDHPELTRADGKLVNV